MADEDRHSVIADLLHVVRGYNVADQAVLLLGIRERLAGRSYDQSVLQLDHEGDIAVRGYRRNTRRDPGRWPGSPRTG